MKKILKYIILLVIALMPYKILAADVCSIGTINYSSVSECITNLTDNAEIKLLQDIGIVTISTNKNINLNLNNHKIESIINNNTKSTIVKNGTIDNLSYTNQPVKNNEDAILVMDGITFGEKVNTDSYIDNSGSIIIRNSKVNSLEENYDRFINNRKNGKITIESGTYTSYDIFRNYGDMVINGGTFIMYCNNVANYNYGKMTINNGSFNANSREFITNRDNTLVINGGIFTGKTVAANFSDLYTSKDEVYSNIYVNGGTFNVDGTAFINSTALNYGNIFIKSGVITSTTTDYILANYPTGTSIIITGGTINAPSSKGIFNQGILTIGENDSIVKKDTPKINIKSGKITGLGNKTLDFYDGIITLNNKLEADALLKINVPTGYYVKYDINNDSTYNAYLIKTNSDSLNSIDNKENEIKEDVLKNPKTLDMNIYVIISLILLLLFIASCSLKRIKSLKNKL